MVESSPMQRSKPNVDQGCCSAGIPELKDYFELTAGNNFFPISREEEKGLASDPVGRMDPGTKEQLVNHNLRFVISIALGYKHYGFSLNDLIQEGNIGLMRAAEKFNPSRGHRFVTYASWWIRAYIQNYIVDNWSLVKLGTTRLERQVFHRVRSRKGLSDPEGLAKRYKKSIEDVSKFVTRMGANDLSLDSPVRGSNGKEGRASLQDFICDGPDCTPEVALDVEHRQFLIQGLVREALGVLDERDRFIIENRKLAADTDDALTLRELGDKFGIGKERVRQLEERALEQIREFIRNAAGEEIEDLLG